MQNLEGFAQSGLLSRFLGFIGDYLLHKSWQVDGLVLLWADAEKRANEV